MILLVWTGAVYSAFYRLGLFSSSSSSSSCLALLLLLLPLSSKAITLFSSRAAAALISPSLLSETHSRSEFGATIFFLPFFFPFCLHSSRRLLEKAMSAYSLWQLRSESGATQLHDPVAGFSRGRRTLLLSDSWGVNQGPRNCTIW